MQDPSGNPRQQGSTLSLTNFIASLGVEPRCVVNNAGNDAMITLLGLQMLVEPGETKIPTPRSAHGMNMGINMSRSGSRSPGALPSLAYMPSPVLASPMSMYGMLGASPGIPGSVNLSPFPASSGRTPEGYFERDTPPSSSRRSSAQGTANDRGAGTGSLNSRRMSTLPPETSSGFGSLRGQRPRVYSTNSMGTREVTGQMASMNVRQDDPSNA